MSRAQSYRVLSVTAYLLVSFSNSQLDCPTQWQLNQLPIIGHQTKLKILNYFWLKKSMAASFVNASRNGMLLSPSRVL
jgi:hypothetical protein